MNSVVSIDNLNILFLHFFLFFFFDLQLALSYFISTYSVKTAVKNSYIVFREKTGRVYILVLSSTARQIN